MRQSTSSVGGHFGELLQGRLGPGGPLALVTLPAPALRVVAEIRPGPFGVHAAGGQRLLDRRQAADVHRAVARGVPRGRLMLRAGMPAGGGAGSSTAAILAAAAACARAHGRPAGEPDDLAALCLRLEGATDPLMYPDPARLLWNPRAARRLADLPGLPALDVVGGFLGPGMRTDPADLDFADIADLAAAWAPAARWAISRRWRRSRPNPPGATPPGAAAPISRRSSRRRGNSAPSGWSRRTPDRPAG